MKVAQIYIDSLSAFQGKFAQNANLEIAASALYLLASPDTPGAALDEALNLASAGETISPKKASQIIEKHTSIAKEAAALGKSLVLPSHGDSILPESDRIDKVTHASPADVDDRPFARSVIVSPPTKTLARIENDFYPTNVLLTKPLLEEVDITGRIIEPCAGDYAIASLLPSEYITNDLYPHAEYVCNYNLDATDPAAWQQWEDLEIDWAVTNPPYNRADEIVPLAFEHTKIGVAVLLRLSYLEPCANRADWLKDNSAHLCQIITLNPRPRFRSDTQNSDNVTVAWMVWRKDFSWNKLGMESPFKFLSGWNAK